MPSEVAEAHLARLEVRDDDREPSRRAAAGSYAGRMPANTVRSLAAEVDDELEQLVGAVDELGRLDARDAQVDASRTRRSTMRGASVGRGCAAASPLTRADVGRLRRLPRASCRPASAAPVGFRFSPDASSSALHRRRVDARRERLVRRDRGAEQRRGQRPPGLRRQTEESLGLGRELRQHRLQVARQHAEQVDALRADRLHLGGARRVLRQQPGLVLVDVEVRAVGRAP